jgi:uncharacterized protein YjlB
LDTPAGSCMAASRVRLCHTRDIRKGNTRLFSDNICPKTTGSRCSRDIALHMQAHPIVKEEQFVEPEQFRFEDNGIFPNSILPVLLYRQAFTSKTGDRASVVEQRFAENNWTNSWRNGVYSFAHYHSTTHEVLGVHDGTATLQVGGEHGRNVELHAGDVIVIPAGVAHQNIGASDDFAVVGAYPDGREWDLLRGRPGERPKADQNIAALPIPDNDPIYGAEGPLRQIWQASRASSK